MRPFLAVAVAFVFGLTVVIADEPRAAEVKKQAIDNALESFTGTWEIASTKPQGVMKDARKLVFRKDMTYAALDKDGKELWAGTFDLDPTASPKVWALRASVGSTYVTNLKCATCSGPTHRSSFAVSGES